MADLESRKHARLAPLRARIRTLDPVTARPAAKRAAPFYLTTEWRGLMDHLLRLRGRQCEVCRRTGCRIFGDHIVELQDGGAELDPSNIRLLCGSCHSAKTARARAARMATVYNRR